MSQTTEITADAQGRLFYARTHVKILIVPLIVQIVMIALHYLSWRYIPETGWEPGGFEVDRWLPIIIHSIIALIEVIYVVVPFLHWYHARFIITEDSVRMTWGLVTRRSREIKISRITQVEMERHISDYLFGCGTIYLHEASSSDAVRLLDVPKVKQAKQILDALVAARADVSQVG